MPKLPEKKNTSAEMPTLPLALLLVLICGGGFFGLLSMVFPGAAMLGVVLVVFGLLFVAQYFIWGRWLHAWVVKKDQEATAAAEAAKD